jgi:hypothetical protein
VLDSVGGGTVVLNYSATNLVPTQKEQPSTCPREASIFRYVNGLGTNKNLKTRSIVLGENQQELTALHCTLIHFHDYFLSFSSFHMTIHVVLAGLSHQF